VLRRGAEKASPPRREKSLPIRGSLGRKSAGGRIGAELRESPLGARMLKSRLGARLIEPPLNERLKPEERPGDENDRLGAEKDREPPKERLGAENERQPPPPKDRLGAEKERPPPDRPPLRASAIAAKKTIMVIASNTVAQCNGELPYDRLIMTRFLTGPATKLVVCVRVTAGTPDTVTTIDFRLPVYS